MQKDNNRFETVKKLVHDDPVAMELVNRFHKGFIAAEKLKKRRNILIVILFIASAITLIVTITELFGQPLLIKIRSLHSNDANLSG